jgi:ADP-ribosylglycohydrolase
LLPEVDVSRTSSDLILFSEGRFMTPWNLVLRDDGGEARALLVDTARRTAGVDVSELAQRSHDDRDVIGRRFSSACYIDGAWPGVLYLACRHAGSPLDALQSNAALGGDNVHRGAVLGVLLGLMAGESVISLYEHLADVESLDEEISALTGDMAS